MNIPLPTNAKMTALVCSGRIRPKVMNWRPAFTEGRKSWKAMMTPTSIPTTPQTTVAIVNARTIVLSYRKRSSSMRSLR